VSDESIARDRVERACVLIESADRLHSLDPRETISRVQSAIAAGAEAQAEDIREAAYRAA
jgi:hypothetical protein